MENKHSKYIKIFAITLFGMELSYSITNPFYLIQKYKTIKDKEE